MAREYEKDSGGNRDADGMRDMIVLQRIGDAKETRLTYRTFGEDADSPYLFATKVAKMAADKSEKGVKALADWYGSWVYGEDLKARQKGKQGGPSEPLVPLGPKEVLNLVTGQVHNREDLKVVIPGQDWPLADRIEYINAVSVQARLARKEAPKAIAAAIKGLEEAGTAKVDGGRLVATKPNGGTTTRTK